MYDTPVRENDIDLRKRGRPKSKQPRDHIVRIRLTDEEYFYFKQMADHFNVNLSELFRMCCKTRKTELEWSGVKFKKYKK